MAKITPKIEVLIDSASPVEDLKEVITTLANPYLGSQRQLEILKSLDLWLGEFIVSIEKQTATANQAKEGADKPAEQTST